MIVKDRNKNIIKNSDGSLDKAIRHVYGNAVGRFILRIFTQPIVSKAVGAFMDSRYSAPLIEPFIKANNINTDDYIMDDIDTYNKFFTRKIIDGKRHIDMAKNSFISPCDAKLSVYKLDSDSVFEIKNSLYRASDLVKCKKLADKYNGGWCMIFRLEVDDYHRYCYIDNGTKSKNNFIKGVLHTVNPIAFEHYNVYKRNCREFSVLHTENFGDVTQIEVGAMFVGKIANHHEKYSFRRGEEKGMFLFGGSTIVLLVEKDKLMPCSEFLENTADNCETIVKMGEKIGISLR